MSTIDWNQYKQAYILTEDKIDKQDYLFREQLDKVKKLVKSLRKGTQGINNANKVIAISGERGSGKSSLLGTIKTAIECDSELKNCWVIGVTDPNEFSDSMGILELILTRMYNEIKLKKSNEKVHCQNELTRDLLKWLDVIAKEKNITGDFYNKLSEIEILDQFNKRITIVDEIGNLLKRAWEYKVNEGNYKVGNIVVLIDDLDLVENERIYKMLEEIKQILSVNVITIISYRPKQLLNSVHNEKILKNINLLNRKYIDDNEIRQQAASYLEKLVPKTQIVFMPRNEEILNKTLCEVFGHEASIINDKYKFNSEKTIIDNIYHSINRLTLINVKSLFVNERSLYEASFNLRTVLQTYEFLVEELSNHTFDKTNLLMNIKKLRDYFYQLSEDLLEIKYFDSITRWLQTGAEYKNYYIYQDIFNFINDESGEEATSELLDINYIQAYNINLGDVLEIIADYKNRTAYTQQKYHYIYIVKILYSILLLESLLVEVYKIEKGKVKRNLKYINQNNNFYFTKTENGIENEFWKTKYYNITRYCILPEDTDLIRKKNLEAKIITDSKIIDYRLLDKILYTHFSFTSEIKQNARIRKVLSRDNKANKSEKNYGYRDPQNYRFRKVFEYRNPGKEKYSEDFSNYLSEKAAVEKNRQYGINPYTYLVKEQYLEAAIINSTYVFYSLFDIDLIFSKPHDRASNKIENNIGYVFKQMTRIWNVILRRKENIFGTCGCGVFEFYTPEELEKITKMFILANTDLKEISIILKRNLPGLNQNQLLIVTKVISGQEITKEEEHFIKNLFYDMNFNLNSEDDEEDDES